ncbi:MAG: hypothetical protein KDC14_18115, partial [Planctomycetes bacterium]|nr:hypothetical protein [Planctomycetota bacterium]
MRHLLPILALCFAACASEGKQETTGRVGAESEVGPGGMALAPYPFTPEAIRESCVEGTILTFRVVARGQQPVTQYMRFHDWDQDAVNVEVRRVTAGGEL